jgi:hypothetical protein
MDRAGLANVRRIIMQTQNAVQNIDAEALSALSGLTDRRHRQLAKAGYFPPPNNGQYPLNATIRGLFKYYRERAKGADPLTQARLAKVESDTELNRLTIDERKRKLVPVDELIPLLGKFLSAARARIDGDPKLEREEKDVIIEDLGKCLDAAFGLQSPAQEPEARGRAQSATID